MGDPGPNNVIAVLFSAFASITSIGVFLNAIWLSHQATSQCDHILDKPLIVMSSFLMALSIVGLYGALTGIRWILSYYGRALLMIIVINYALTVFALVVTTKSPGVMVPGKDYMVGNNNSWLKRRVNNNWNKITSFFQQTKICDHNLSSIKSGCCKPSNDCSNSSSTNPDCSKWSSDEKVLCYGCESCKIAWTNMIRPKWRRVAITNFILLVFIIAGNIVLFHNVNPLVPISRVIKNGGRTLELCTMNDR